MTKAVSAPTITPCRSFPGSALGEGPAPPTCPASLGFCRRSLHLRRPLCGFGLTQIRFLTFAYIRAVSWTAVRPPSSGHRRIWTVNIQFWSRAWANYWSVRWVPPLRETGWPRPNCLTTLTTQGHLESSLLHHHVSGISTSVLFINHTS